MHLETFDPVFLSQENGLRYNYRNERIYQAPDWSYLEAFSAKLFTNIVTENMLT
jgi:hypothetical protein